MQIECILKREGGTVAEIGGIDYHFEPLADGAHVAEVENDDHVDRFLSISEGYRLYRPGKNKPADETAPEDDAERAALAEQYEAKFGKKPHYKKSIDAIKAELAAE